MPEAVRPWPRMMKRATAAEYCDLSIPAFEREIIDGRLPNGVLLGGRTHWDRLKIDEALDRLHGEIADDWRSRSGLYGNAA